MNESVGRRFWRALAVASGMTLLAPAVIGYAQTGGAAKDPKKVSGAEACGECHTAELNAWKQTHHTQ